MRIAPAELLAYRARLAAPDVARARGHPGEVRPDARAVQPRGVGGARARCRRRRDRRQRQPHRRAALARRARRRARRRRRDAGARSAAASTPRTPRSCSASADGAIVGTSLLQDGHAQLDRVTALVARCRARTRVNIVCAADCGVDRFDDLGATRPAASA